MRRKIIKKVKKQVIHVSKPAPVVLITSLEQLLFTEFIRCSCDNDFSCLVKSGKPSPAQIHEAWIEIVSKYQELTETDGAKEQRIKQSDIERKNAKIVIVSSIIEVIRPEDTLLIQELKEWGYPFAFTADSFAKDKARVAAMLANDKLRLQMARADYDGAKEKEGEKTTTKEQYMKALSAIEEKKKMEYDLDKLTMYKFAILYKELIEHNNLIKAKYSGHGSK